MRRTALIFLLLCLWSFAQEAQKPALPIVGKWKLISVSGDHIKGDLQPSRDNEELMITQTEKKLTILELHTTDKGKTNKFTENFRLDGKSSQNDRGYESVLRLIGNTISIISKHYYFENVPGGNPSITKEYRVSTDGKTMDVYLSMKNMMTCINDGIPVQDPRDCKGFKSISFSQTHTYIRTQ